MKICFLAPSNSAHTKKWCRYFVSRGHEVHVVSFCNEQIENVKVHYVNSGADTGGGDAQKLKYLLKARLIRKIILDIMPDIINVHYATSYGAVAALAGLKGYVLSVWGSDIFEFPKRSFLHRTLLKFSLSKAKYLFSTSQAMADEAKLYTKKEFVITPFGVDMELFNPRKRIRHGESFVVGTVKSLAPIYGIDLLLKAVAQVHNFNPEIPIRIRIAGQGPSEKEYHELAKYLGIDEITQWLGVISQQQAAYEWANMDVAVICSNMESFGVAAVEAQASGVPVIISDIPGLKEATKPDYSSVVIPKGDINAIANALRNLYKDEAKRKSMGYCGRVYVEKKYEYNACFKIIEDCFERIMENERIS